MQNKVVYIYVYLKEREWERVMYQIEHTYTHAHIYDIIYTIHNTKMYKIEYILSIR